MRRRVERLEANAAWLLALAGMFAAIGFIGVAAIMLGRAQGFGL